MHIELEMQSLGFEVCDDCKKKIPRGELWYGVVYQNGDPYGRICDKCLNELKEKCKAQAANSN